MSNLGIRISQEDVDVKTGSDKEMVLTSKYSIFKGATFGSGTVSVERDGTDAVVTIPHGLGYIPMVDATWNDADGIIFDPDQHYKMPSYSNFGTLELFFRTSADATNVYLIFSVQDL